MCEGQIEITLGSSGNSVLTLSLKGMLARVFELPGGEFVVNRVAQVQLADQRATRRVGLFVDFLDDAFGVLQIVMSAINNPRRKPGKELKQRTLVERPGLGEPFSREAHVQILRAREPQRGGQVNEIDIGRNIVDCCNGRLRTGSRGEAEQGTGQEDQREGGRHHFRQPWFRKFHFASLALTACPSFKACLPARITGSSGLMPSTTSTETPSLKPTFTGTFLALPSATVNTEFFAFSTTSASAGMVRASRLRSSSSCTEAYMPGR